MERFDYEQVKVFNEATLNVFYNFISNKLFYVKKIRENTEQKNSEYGLFSRSAIIKGIFFLFFIISAIPIKFHLHCVNLTWKYQMYNPDSAETEAVEDLLCGNVSKLQ